MLFFAVKCTRFIAVKITVLNDKLKTVYFLPPPPFPPPQHAPKLDQPFSPWGTLAGTVLHTLSTSALSTALPSNLSLLVQTRYVSHLEQKAQQGAEQALTNMSRYW